MIEVVGDLWDHPARVKCIPTNGYVNRQGAAVMGKGVALEARQQRPGIQWELGWLLTTFGNQTQVICSDYGLGCILVAFPTKRKWNERSDLGLIDRSARILRDLTDINGWEEVVLPRPGCGNGGLRWEDVRPIIAPHLLGDRFIITNKEG